MDEAADWVGDDLLRPLVRIAMSDASQADRQRGVQALIEEWRGEFDEPDPPA